MANKVTQKQAILYQLYNHRHDIDAEAYIPAWHMIGEVLVDEIGQWGFVSYEVSARLSEMYKENPLLLERVWIEGKTGAKYYGYRIAKNARPEDVVNPELSEFYSKIRRKPSTLKSIFR